MDHIVQQSTSGERLVGAPPADREGATGSKCEGWNGGGSKSRTDSKAGDLGSNIRHDRSAGHVSDSGRERVTVPSVPHVSQRPLCKVIQGKQKGNDLGDGSGSGDRALGQAHTSAWRPSSRSRRRRRIQDKPKEVLGILLPRGRGSFASHGKGSLCKQASFSRAPDCSPAGSGDVNDVIDLVSEEDSPE